MVIFAKLGEGGDTGWPGEGPWARGSRKPSEGSGMGEGRLGGRGMGRQGWGTSRERGRWQLGWWLEGGESQPPEFPMAGCLDVQVLTPKIACSNPG